MEMYVIPRPEHQNATVVLFNRGHAYDEAYIVYCVILPLHYIRLVAKSTATSKCHEYIHNITARTT